MPNPLIVSLRRSCLTVPASSPRALEKAAAIAADELVFHVEEAVSPVAEERARETVMARLAEWPGATLTVRVNSSPTPWCHLELGALGTMPGPQPPSVVVPTVENAADVEFVERLLAGARAGGARREWPLGLQALVLGYADLASLGRSRERAGDPPAWLAAHDRPLSAPPANSMQAIDAPFLAIAPGEPFIDAALRACQCGIDGRWAIHPFQMEAPGEIFTASAEEVEHAWVVLTALKRAETDSGPGAIAVDGEMLPASARRVLIRTGGTVI